MVLGAGQNQAGIRQQRNNAEYIEFAGLKRRANMIRQPEWGTRNVSKYFYESEARRIAALNEIFGDIELTAAEMRTLVWLCGWEECTVKNVLSAIRKAMAAEAKRREQPPRP